MTMPPPPTDGVCLQINLAASDIRYVRHTLPHQLRALGNQVDEILLVVDTRKSRTGRFATADFDKRLTELRAFIASLRHDWPTIRALDVDYSEDAMQRVAMTFTNGAEIPIKAYDGSAFYAYLYGMMRASFPFVLHSDADMLYGGSSQVWIAEARLLLENRTVAAVFPLPGPPTSVPTPTKRNLITYWNDEPGPRRCVSSDLQLRALSYNEMTTRSVMIDLRRFLARELTLPLVRPRLHKSIKAFLVNTWPYRLLEDCFTAMVNAEGLQCVGFLGSKNGMWTLHPARRSERFFRELPSIVKRVESDDIPDDQRGDFDLNASIIDWSDVIVKTTRWTWLKRNASQVAQGLLEKLAGT